MAKLLLFGLLTAMVAIVAQGQLRKKHTTCVASFLFAQFFVSFTGAVIPEPESNPLDCAWCKVVAT